MIIDGKELARKTREKLKIECDNLKKEGILSKLAVIMVGDDKASQIYVKNKSKACQEIGIKFEEYFLGNDIKQEELIELIQKLNLDKSINGILLQSPIPKSLDIIKFETNSNNIVVRYYYQTLLENIESENISEDMSIKIIGNLKKNSTIYLQINCNDTEAKELRIALPNSLRLANTENLKGYWIMNNAIDYISVYKQKGYSSIKIPLIVTLDGNYKFENIVNNQNGIYHISNSLDLDIK